MEGRETLVAGMGRVEEPVSQAASCPLSREQFCAGEGKKGTKLTATCWDSNWGRLREESGSQSGCLCIIRVCGAPEVGAFASKAGGPGHPVCRALGRTTRHGQLFPSFPLLAQIRLQRRLSTAVLSTHRSI